jgi:thioredoxin reductase (NADPH)
MLTLDDVRDVPLFAGMATEDLRRLVETSADMQLAPGEFAVPEGGERALFAVLAGRIEVVKLVNGVERTLGWRLPGTIFGEVPIALGTPFPGGYRAAEPARVMRVDMRQYYALAAAYPAFATRMGALARERIGGLQGVAAEAPKPAATIIARPGDPAGASSPATRSPSTGRSPKPTPSTASSPASPCPPTAPPPCCWPMARCCPTPPCARSPSASACKPCPAWRNTTR